MIVPAFLILAHADPRQFGRLVRRLDGYGDIYVHVDRRADISSFMAAIGDAKVNFIEDRVRISWGGISMVEAENRLLSAASKSSRHHTHVVFLSGACYPIKPLQSLLDRLDAFPRAEHIRLFDLSFAPNGLERVTRRWHWEPYYHGELRAFRFLDKCARRSLDMLRLPNRWDGNFHPCFGSQWSALTIECAEHIRSYLREHPAYHEANQHVFAPDESYYHSIIASSPFAASAGGIIQHFPFSGGTDEFSSTHLIHPSLQKWYTLEDIKEIKASDKFFVRKIRSSDGSSLVDYLDSDASGL